ncbi:ABC transporter ATP-binding protein [Archaeoglobales archaeon ex4484_92]|nr:MAG: ABC transporter ATP-binding protein [Archaeoglobales archaeon ex4484_92]HDN73982.1 ATP-binding cassette domain-containing protein [Archaeoglobus sp.]
MNVAKIEAVNLSRRFGEILAVKNVSFKVKKGEIFAFLGPNGAGKTTTIYMLTTLLKPTSGYAKVAGYDVVRDAREVRKRIGIVFQDPSLDRDLTAYENMLIHAGVYGLARREVKEKIDHLLNFVELWEFKDKPVKYFSTGMRRRLEIARSLIHEPEVLFLDEPTLGLDPQTRAHIWDYIRSMRDEGNTTIFLTTHYMEEAEFLADRVAIIDRGEIIAEGSCDELKKMIGKDIVYVRANGEIKLEFAEAKRLEDGRIRFEVANAAEAIPKIFDAASRSGVKIDEISYRRPTLNDVFLYFTGRDIRE